MIADLKAYPEYKESKIPWLARLPEHWERDDCGTCAKCE